MARRGVFLSDNNRYGNGRTVVRLAKLLCAVRGVSHSDADRNPAANVMTESAKGDGLWYSYSVYDAYPQLAQWADRVFFAPTSAVTGRSWVIHCSTATQLLCAQFAANLIDCQEWAKCSPLQAILNPLSP